MSGATAPKQVPELLRTVAWPEKYSRRVPAAASSQDGSQQPAQYHPPSTTSKKQWATDPWGQVSTVLYMAQPTVGTRQPGPKRDGGPTGGPGSRAETPAGSAQPGKGTGPISAHGARA
ncbi:unnamed protein product [Clonostachys rosea]|uniref:Uncharacterized protein n=1 Tax=Bionectria ochroleuca TaxID=29856 RepID=A0ABY6UQC0_BIOOC|nr:unnamed protein product [Clonostachys rosea]